MSRFANLEFDDKRAGAPKPDGAPLRNAQSFAETANEFYLAGDFEKALRDYTRALEQNSAFFEGWSGQIRMLIELGEHKEALLWADKALELFPENPSLFALKSIACCRAGVLDKSMAYSDNAIAARGATPDVWLARGEILFRRRSPMAGHCVIKAIGLAEKTVPVVRLEAGRLLIRVNRYSDALSHLAQAVSVLPKAALAWYELGRCQRALGLPAAVESFEASLRLRPRWEKPQKALDQFNSRGLAERLKGAFRRFLGD